jgi:hypothetical protein
MGFEERLEARSEFRVPLDEVDAMAESMTAIKQERSR